MLDINRQQPCILTMASVRHMQMYAVQTQEHVDEQAQLKDQIV